MKKIINIIPGSGYRAYLFKDPGMIIYSLARYCNYDATHAYLNEIYHHDEFEVYGKMLSMGYADETNRKACLTAVKEFIKNNIKNYDVVFLFNYGSANYKLAWLCKRYNPNIIVYCKLDMSDGGYSHFYESSFSRKIKNYTERIKSRYVDLFTVETLKYYNDLKDNAMFSGGRLQYLPNGVSTLGIDKEKLYSIQKENIVLTVGRLGIYEKNNEMLLDVISQLPEDIVNDWKFYFVGPMTDSFSEYAAEFLQKYPNLQKSIVFTGAVADREKLYEIYAKSKIYCLTSRSEGFNISVLEALYAGCYPILTNYGVSIQDVTNGGRIGSICEQGDVKSFAEKLQQVMLADNKKLSKEIREFARSKYDYKAIAEKLDGYISKISRGENT